MSQHSTQRLNRRPQRVAGVATALGLALLLATTTATADIAFEDHSSDLGLDRSLTDTWGATWGDLDSDGYPDIYLSNHFSNGRLLVNQQDGSFSDVSREVDISGVFSFIPGQKSRDLHAATWADLDNDGDLDLVQSWSGRNPIMTNEEGRLTARFSAGTSTRMPLLYDRDNDGVVDNHPIGYFNSACFGDSGPRKQRHWGMLTDLNGSGRLDVLCAVASASFPDAATYYGDGPPASLPTRSPTIDAISGDFDGDLRPDLISLIANERPTAVSLINSTLVESHLTSAGTRKVLTIRTTGDITIQDLNSDAWIGRQRGMSAGIGTSRSQTADSFTLSASDPANHGMRDGSGLFIGYLPAEAAWQVALESASYDLAHVIIEVDAPINAADVSLAPLAIGADLPSPPLYVRNAATGMVEVTPAESGLGEVFCATGVSGDFDNDMDLDLYLGCRTSTENTRNRVFENLGDGTFAEVLNHGGEGPLGGVVTERMGAADSAVLADYDLDGYLDLFVANGENLRPKRIGGPKTLLRNRGGSNASALFDLRGRSSNRGGIGAKLYITTPDGRVQYREQNGGYHKHAQNHMRVHVGLANHSLMSRVEVHWPSGTITAWEDVPANAVYVLDEDGTLRTRFELARDTDGDGTPDVRDIDDDNDGIPDHAETGNTGRIQLLAWGNGAEFTRLGSDLFDFGRVSSIRINAAPRPVAVIDDDGNFEGDDIAGERSDDQTQQFLIDGRAVPAFHDYTLRFANAAGEETTLLVIDVDRDGDGVAGTEPEDGAYLVHIGGRVPHAGDTLIRAGSHLDTLAQSTVTAYTDLPTPDFPVHDQDGDGVPNALDLDSDNDGIADVVEAGLADFNDDALVDLPSAAGTITAPADSDGDGIADFLDLESLNAGNDTTVLDLYSTSASALDENGNGRLDAGDSAAAGDRDQDGIDDRIDGYPNGHGGQAPTATLPVCGEPQIDSARDRGTFLWKSCDASEQWHLRVSGGSTPSRLDFTGEMRAPGGLLSLIPQSIEGSDLLDTSDPTRLSYRLVIYDNGIDGFDFTAPPNACFRPEGPDTLPVYLGGQRQELLNADLDLDTGTACPVPEDRDGDGLSDAEEAVLGTDPDRSDTDGGTVSDGDEVRNGTDPLDPSDDVNPTADACGEPQFDAGTEPGLYLWKDCSAAGTEALWRVRAVAGGLRFSEFAGVLSANTPLNATPISTESADTVDSVPADGEIDFSLFVANRGVDGFDLTLPAGSVSCFNAPTLPGGAPILLGAGKRTLNGPFNLEDLGACQ